jgi:gamma-glutamyltranspeptidase/glutathione hydrolase
MRVASLASPKGRAAAASQAGVAEIVGAILSRGNAVDAVAAGVLAAAALVPSVLLGPVQILVGGAGAGLRAVDGRCRQPGRRVGRPRGFVLGAPVPLAARVATPLLPAALATAVATFGRLSFAELAAPAVDVASGPRAKVLERVARRGAAALADARVSSEIIAAVGRVAGGLVGQADLDDARPGIVECELASLGLGEGRAIRAPWATDPLPSSASVQVVAATDAKGLVAVACYEAADDGVDVPELGLVAPLFAAPVLRGETRVRPGEPRPAASPIVLVEHDALVDLAVGAAGPHAVVALGAFLGALAGADTVDVALAAGGAQGAPLRGVARSRVGARGLVVG